jgi:hypothetical protein
LAKVSQTIATSAMTRRPCGPPADWVSGSAAWRQAAHSVEVAVPAAPSWAAVPDIGDTRNRTSETVSREPES